MKHIVVLLLGVLFFLTACSSSSSSSSSEMTSSWVESPASPPINKDAQAVKDFQKDLDGWYQKNNVQ